LHQLIEKFYVYGVVIEQVNIMKVFLPADLRYALSATTTYDVWLQKQVKEKFYKLLKISHNEGKQLLTLQRNNK